MAIGFRVLVLASCLVVSPAFAADQQFDLICKGQQRIMPSRKWRDYEVRYRVDVSRMIYCRFDCSATETLAAADAARITFQVPENDSAAAFIAHYVDRSDGHWTYFVGGDSEAKGVCERAPFSGFPAAKF